jgi:fructokinase
MRIGIDLGGTKIEGVVLDHAGAIVARERLVTPSGYTDTLGQIAHLVGMLERDVGQTGLPVGLGHPGAISPATGMVKNANSTHLNGQMLDRDLARALGRPVALANDANCFALSEAVDGAGAGHALVLGVILGTGVGGGVVWNGRVRSGPNAIMGEWGHTLLPYARPDEHPGPKCWCGKDGCVETWLSGPAFERWCGTEPAAADPQAIVLYADRLARALSLAVNILDPDIIVLGGGVSNIDALYAEVNRLLPAYVFTDSLSTRVVKHQHGDSSGVRGAAWLNSLQLTDAV